MPGNSGRRGAVRKGGSKKGATVGSGGQRRRGLEGRGPTPRAEDRVHHPAHQKKVAAERREAARPRVRTPGWVRALPEGTEFIVGRNAVHEAVLSGMPVHSVYVASGVTSDERVSHVLQAATDAGTPMFEVSRSDLESVADGQSHQGLAIAVPPYQYEDVHDVVDAALEHVAPPLLVALDGVTDPHNLGAVLRNAGAFG
ncbi:MAG: 23S rRNA (guanosine(2251)-2'-O)-methyltransferase RlmB, partial [Actinomycetes bacterium]|nr:23S rRNA (guanosine(2251)-2'-O)-methyltransferase RlmB [Actinomycetes bacterium]MDX5380995.1 23S rRNA (guanosine(2251)-2'-O)-methyltransferase RlmB [Actinomycetes bacterium]MDX5400135.1 23S rRNA (guanosine(2251)-2'-O)-methyltransferase RlmB [Actinomycetes bacterium]MDX5450755.1 23S rRNA (guanosine(2251)-2'-O)-methyltransferase RlmB [Actinomycetes bacterium]